MHLKVPPAALAVLAVMLMVALRSVLPQFTYALPYKEVVAVLLGVVGIFVAVAGIYAFRRLKTTVNPTRPGTATSLVIDGIYRWTRNPMYLGIVLCLIACGVYLANVVALIVAPAVFVLYLNHFQIKPEEEALALIFGEAYVKYQASVRRWL